jgi:DNA-directed RNA polymerase sigma subunit (sigma70/sigma32)
MDESAAFIAALADLEQALEANIERARRMQARIVELRDAHAAGLPLREFVPREEQPLIVRLLSESARELDACGSVVRRMEARALYEEGLTMDEIAELFGVSRQRVSALLRNADPRPR